MTQHTVIDVTAELRALRREVSRLAEAIERAETGDEWVTVDEAAKRMRRSKATVYRKIAAGDMQSRRVGGVKLVRVWRS